jgi:hypothetical protein
VPRDRTTTANARLRARRRRLRPVSKLRQWKEFEEQSRATFAQAYGPQAQPGRKDPRIGKLG